MHGLVLIPMFSFPCPVVPAAVRIAEDIKVSTQLLGAVSYFKYDLPEEGITIRLNVTKGQVVLYASTRITTPNSAFYDIRLETDSSVDVFINPEDLLMSHGPVSVGRRKRCVEGEGDNSCTSRFLYVSVEGLRGNNSYVLETKYGDTSTCELVTQLMWICIPLHHIGTYVCC